MHAPRPRRGQLDEVADACARRAPAPCRSGRAGSRRSLPRRAARGGTAARRSRTDARARRGSPAGARAAGARGPTVSTTVARRGGRSGASSRCRGTPCRSARCARRAPHRRRTRGSGAHRRRPAARAAALRHAARSALRPRAAAERPGWPASGTAPRARGRGRGRRRSRTGRAVPGSQARRLEVEDDERRLLEQQLLTRSRLRARPGRRPTAAARRRCTASSSSERASPTGTDAAELQHEPRGVLGGDGPAPFLDELDEPVGGIQAQLHRGEPSTNMCSCPARTSGAQVARRPPTSVAVSSRSAAATASAVSGSWPSTQPVSTSSRPP